MSKDGLTIEQKLEIGATRLTHPRMSVDAVARLAARYGTTPWKVRALRERWGLMRGCPPVPKGRIPTLTPGQGLLVAKLVELRRLLSNKGLGRALHCEPATVSKAGSSDVRDASAIALGQEDEVRKLLDAVRVLVDRLQAWTQKEDRHASPGSLGVRPRGR